MRYTVDIERSIDSLTNCLKRVNNGIEDIWEWRVSINAGGIDDGIFFNFNVKEKELEICNQPGYGYDDSYYLDEIIDIINENTEEDEE